LTQVITMSKWCTLRSDGDGVLVAEGELDVATLDRLREHLDDHHVRAIDLAGVTFIDSSALAVLVAAHQARGSDGLVLRQPSDAVRRLLEVSGLDQYLPIQR
jgi:anti-sigma B factor antagonist